MKWMTAVAVLAVLAAAGCAGPEDSATVPLQDLPPVPTAQHPDQAQTDNGSLPGLAQIGKPMQNDFVAADDAEQCPMVNVTTMQNQAVELQPGRAGFVTIVVVWSMDNRPAISAALVVNDLVRKYTSLGVRGVGIVEPTEGAGNVEAFAGAMQMTMPLFYDNLKQSALRELAGAAGASDRTAFPAIFIIDRHLRLRFYRPGLRFALVAKMENGQKVNQWIEDAPDDQKIEHFLTQVLNEQW